MKKQIEISYIINHMFIRNCVFFKSDYKAYSIDEIDVNKYNQYRDYIYLPFIDEKTVYIEFLKKYNLTSFSKSLKKQEDFSVTFRKYIERTVWNGIYLQNLYNDFIYEYLKKDAIKWCCQYKINYIDNI